MPVVAFRCGQWVQRAHWKQQDPFDIQIVHFSLIVHDSFMFIRLMQLPLVMRHDGVVKKWSFKFIGNNDNITHCILTQRSMNLSSSILVLATECCLFSIGTTFKLVTVFYRLFPVFIIRVSLPTQNVFCRLHSNKECDRETVNFMFRGYRGTSTLICLWNSYMKEKYTC